MQVTKGTWRMREQCVPGSLSSSPAREPGNEARDKANMVSHLHIFWARKCNNATSGGTTALVSWYYTLSRVHKDAV